MFEFRPLAQADLPMLLEWLNRPHVAEWWDSERSLDEVRVHYLPDSKSPDDADPYIALIDGRPAAYIQSYVHGAGVIGIDQFLANPEDLGRGLGTALVTDFTKHLFANPEVTRIIVDPSPKNPRAIRCYEKSGFRFVENITTLNGPAYLMAIERSRSPASPVAPS
jgi:RimJ/RimL family protein N-acetyltransferase